MLVRVIDFETTGMPTDEDRQAIVEIGWCDVENGVVSEPQSRLVNPHRPIPIDAMAIHHITDAMVADGISDTAARLLLSEGKPGIYVAHNADYERSFYAPEHLLCTYKAALRIWPDAEKHNNSYLRYYLGLELEPEKAEPPHRAGPDAYVTAHIFVRLMAAAEEKGVTLEDMLRWSKGPALLPRINFGKHKGSKWDDVPRDYLDWIVNKSDLDRDTKANAKHWLRQREGQ